MAKYKFKADPHMGRQIVLDTETTGLSPRTGHKIVEVGAVEVIDGKLTGKHFHSYVNPKRFVPDEAAEVHGLTTNFLKDKPTFEVVGPQLLDFVGDPETILWAHNAPFDARFLNSELEGIGLDTLSGFQCSLKLARAVLGSGKRTLDILAHMADVRFAGRGAHSALADSEVLAKVLCKLLWPAEAKICLDPGKAPGPKTKTPSKTLPDSRNTPKEIILPEGFLALQERDDERICRYDEVEVDHLITSRGKRWSSEEEQKLVDRFIKDRAGIIDLVADHGRTPAAIFLKLEGLKVVAPGHPYTRVR